MMNADGSDLTQLTDDSGDDWGPIWSPDGQCIVFHSDRGGETEIDIYVMNADGSDLTQLTNAPGSDWMYVWTHRPVRPGKIKCQLFSLSATAVHQEDRGAVDTYSHLPLDRCFLKVRIRVMLLSDFYSDTYPLHFASERGRIETIQALIAAGADPDTLTCWAWGHVHTGPLLTVPEDVTVHTP